MKYWLFFKCRGRWQWERQISCFLICWSYFPQLPSLLNTYKPEPLLRKIITWILYKTDLLARNSMWRVIIKKNCHHRWAHWSFKLSSQFHHRHRLTLNFSKRAIRQTEETLDFCSLSPSGISKFRGKPALLEHHA